MSRTGRRAALAGLLCALLLPVLAAAAGSAATPVRIGIIGTGHIGGTLARLWVAAGHEVLISSRHPDELKGLAAELGARAHVAARCGALR